MSDSENTNSLFAITRTLHELEAAVIEANGELGEELEERISVATIMLEQKSDAYAAILARCESIDAEYSAQADLLKNVARGAVQLAKRLKDNLKEAMRQLDVVDLAGERVRFRLQNSKPKTIVFDEALLPLDFKTRVVSLVPDLDKISKAIAEGVDVPGARLETRQSLNKYAPKKEIK